jgi:hypothetical protein
MDGLDNVQDEKRIIYFNDIWRLNVIRLVLSLHDMIKENNPTYDFSYESGMMTRLASKQLIKDILSRVRYDRPPTGETADKIKNLISKRRIPDEYRNIPNESIEMSVEEYNGIRPIIDSSLKMSIYPFGWKMSDKSLAFVKIEFKMSASRETELSVDCTVKIAFEEFLTGLYNYQTEFLTVGSYVGEFNKYDAQYLSQYESKVIKMYDYIHDCMSDKIKEMILSYQ